ncbi:efflux RND transporter periplasmic adaptor subunit [Chitinophaga sp. XS-30]|uniref:efflux RND transporter periplasmic adaptor subunit n=1 Tax=Chitinophaga sp. XS-30 TaxID=2604421 RepID=UPI00143D7BD2|nr:efflux RND transporter periplasmic adaptor subunit [Chitinophaga sp. XS-30]
MTNNNMRVISILSAAIFLVSCDSGSKSPASETPGTDTVPAFILKADTARKTVELPAELLPYEQAVLFARVEGFVRSMKADLGDNVKKGQVLAVIEAPEVSSRFAESEATLLSAKAKWASSRDNFERLYRASKAETPGIVAPADLERSRQQMLADSAGYEAAARQSQAYKAVSGYLHITAPFDGVITARNADPGTLVGSGAMLFTIQNNRTLRLRAAVPEVYVNTAASLKEVAFTVDAWPTQQFTATLTRKSGAIDPATRTELWEFKVDNSRQLLKAGAFAYVKISMERQGISYVVPAPAIATTQERKFVIVVKHGEAQWVDVRQGMVTNKGVEVFGNLNEGDTVLVKGTDERKPGTSAHWKVQR